MIQTKDELKEYLQWDKIALHKEKVRRPRLGRDEIWRYEILLRKAEYYTNNDQGIKKIPFMFYKARLHRMSIKLGFSIPVNVFDKGLSIAHYGTIVVNDHARIGRNCRIQENVTIGSTGGSEKAPQIGNNVFIASGARIIGDIKIADNVAIGANAVVTTSIRQIGVTLAGVPAKMISNKGSVGFVSEKLKDKSF